MELIYCVVLTQNAGIANALIDMNAWVKLNPLRGCYVSDVNPGTDAVPEDTHHFPHPTWTVTWTLEQLQALVESHFDARMLDLVNARITEGMSPSWVLSLCYEMENEWRRENSNLMS